MTEREPEIVVGGREQLLQLLAEAAEIEHTLMCSYLYAAFSLKDGSEPGLSAAQGEAVRRWRAVIMDVAVQEMAHLLMVGNLAIALGGRPHLARPNFPVTPGYFPSGVVVRLAPFDRDTLDHFVFLERPTGHALPDGRGYDDEPDYVREQAYRGLTPSLQDYATVGHLYEAVRTNLVEASRQLGEARLFVGSAAAQIGPPTVDLPGVAVVDGLAAALRAIDTIVEQGEGSPGDRDDSHYLAFLSIRDEYERLRADDPGFEPAWPAAENPVMRRPPEPEGKVYVDEPAAARVLDFSNAVYAMLLRLLVQAWGTRPAEGTGAALMSAAIDLMHVLGRSATALTRMPASRAAPGVRAGMSFTSLRGADAPFEQAAEAALIDERLAELHGAARTAERANAALAGLADELAGVRTRLAEQLGHRD
ncbi:MAG TPA: ferritin-like protein [Burkholderiaceae bacterium]|nr:ferritin-like protein [Burkholderiaceae bacterium]